MANIERWPRRVIVARWDDGTLAGVYGPERGPAARSDMETGEYVRADLHRGAVEACERWREWTAGAATGDADTLWHLFGVAMDELCSRTLAHTHPDDRDDYGT